MKLGQIFVLLIAVTLFAQTKEKKVMAQEADIPFQKFTLDNGLTVVIHEDHKAPIVAVNIWYHVGSKNEKSGKTGFAHLFEHLMFNGSENYDHDYFQMMEKIGATDLNGTTNEDRTNYFQNVPVAAFDVALWMESERMGHLIGAISQAKLDEQRGVVQNEKRQGENEPYSLAEDLIVKATWPAGHPYSWTVIGSMEDLNAASLTDVQDWFKGYYGTANATIVIAGDVDTKDALDRVKKYFGDIPAGPPVSRFESWIAKRTGTQRQSAQDRVPLPKVSKIWNVPGYGTRDAAALDIVSDILSSGKNSRLYKRLVYDDQIATDANAYVDIREIAGQFTIEAKAKPGVDISKVEKALNEELAKFLAEGPTQKELDRVRTQYFAGKIRGMERIGGFGGKSDILARSQTFGDSPDAYKSDLKYVESFTPLDLQKAAQTWLSDGVYVLTITPFAEYKAATAGADRKNIPAIGNSKDAEFPKIQKSQLFNGLAIWLSERKNIPVVGFNLQINAGAAADQFALPGTASLAMGMLDEGTTKRNSLQISEELAMLGTNLGSGSNLDMSVVSMNSLKANLDASLDIYADVILNPSFPDADFQRLKKQQKAGIQQEKVSPVPMALRVFPKLFYGEGHAYGNPLTGSGTEESVDKMTREDMIKFHQTWFKPNNATLVVVGDITMDELKSKLESRFKSWKQGEIPKKNIADVVIPKNSSVYIIDRPGSQQSLIFAGHLTVPKNNPDEIAIELMTNVIGGDFTSRINMNLREDKHWSYGASAFTMDARGMRPFIGYASVQSDKTKESILEMKKEFKEFISTRLMTEDEFSKVQNNMIQQLPGSWETNAAVSGTMGAMVRYGFDDSYPYTYVKKVRELKLADAQNAAKKTIKPDTFIWLIVGDRSRIEAGIKELKIGDVNYLDASGNSVK